MHCRRILYSANYLTVTFCSFPLALDMLLPFLPYHVLPSFYHPTPPHLLNRLPSNSSNLAPTISGLSLSNPVTLSSNAFTMASATFGATPALSAAYMGFAKRNSRLSSILVTFGSTSSTVHVFFKCVSSPSLPSLLTIP